MKTDMGKGKKIGAILTNILLYFFLAVCVFSLVVTFISKKDADGAANLFGYQIRLVTSNSMEKCDQTNTDDFDIKSIPLRSMIFIQTVPEDPEEAKAWYEALEIGDVLTFRYVYTSQVTITHRIIDKRDNGMGGYYIELAGDNKNADSDQLTQIINTSLTDSPNYVIGKVTGQAYLIGLILSVIKSPLGIIFIIIVPCLIIIVREALRIFNVISAEKKQKAAEEAAQKDSELEALRRRLAEFEGRADPPSDEENKE